MCTEKDAILTVGEPGDIHNNNNITIAMYCLLNCNVLNVTVIYCKLL